MRRATEFNKSIAFVDDVRASNDGVSDTVDTRNDADDEIVVANYSTGLGAHNRFTRRQQRRMRSVYTAIGRVDAFAVNNANVGRAQ